MSFGRCPNTVACVRVQAVKSQEDTRHGHTEGRRSSAFCSCKGRFKQCARVCLCIFRNEVGSQSYAVMQAWQRLQLTLQEAWEQKQPSITVPQRADLVSGRHHRGMLHLETRHSHGAVASFYWEQVLERVASTPSSPDLQRALGGMLPRACQISQISPGRKQEDFSEETPGLVLKDPLLFFCFMRIGHEREDIWIRPKL